MKWHALSWIINSECNLCCAHCYPNSTNKNKNCLTSLELQRLSDNLQSMYFEKIYISGGEPLLCEQLPQYLDIAGHQADKLYICTNSLLLDEKKLALLIDHHVKITISLQHTDPQKAAAIYGSEEIGQRIIQRIVSLRHENVPIKLEVTMMRTNFQSLESFFIFVIKNGIHEIHFKRFRPIGRGALNSMNFALTPEENQTALEELFWLAQKYPTLEVSTDDPFYGVTILQTLKTQGMGETSAREYLDNKRIFGCKAAMRWIGLAYNGEVAPCPLLFYCGVSIGNVLIRSLEEIIQSSKLINALRQVRYDRCVYSKYCGGCRVCAFAHTGNIFGIDPMCTLDKGKGCF